MTVPYTFVALKQKDYFKYLDKEFQTFLEKWGMKRYMLIQKYSFNQAFDIYDKQKFCDCFFNDPNVINSLKVIQNEQWNILGQNCANVSVKLIPCTALSMTYFDKLVEGDNEIIRGSIINKCFDEEIQGILVQDKLRQIFKSKGYKASGGEILRGDLMLINPESEEYQLFSDQERDEFIFRIFQHLVLGGRLCQFEDEINNYITCTKLFYKHLISVLKDPQTKKLKITSIVLEVKVEDFNGQYIYPQDPEHPQNFAYLIIDSPKRELKVLTHYAGSLYFD